jgi:hypothetical protein
MGLLRQAVDPAGYFFSGLALNQNDSESTCGSTLTSSSQSLADTSTSAVFNRIGNRQLLQIAPIDEDVCLRKFVDLVNDGERLGIRQGRRVDDFILDGLLLRFRRLHGNRGADDDGQG